MSYLSNGIAYFHSVTCIAKPTKCLTSAENCVATESWKQSYEISKFEKVQGRLFHVPTCPIFTGPVTICCFTTFFIA